MRDVIRLLTAVERSEKQEHTLTVVRDRCARADAELRAQGADLTVTVPQALEELLDGTPSATESPAYTHAFHHLVAAHFSDTTDLGVWSRPSWFFTLDEELSRHGIPPELLPGTFLFSGPPLRLPHTGDAYPQIGTLPTPLAAPLADSYERVLPLLHPDYRETTHRFAELMRFEAQEWETARKLGQRQDTIFFWIG